MNTRLWLSLALLCSCGPLPMAQQEEAVGTGSKVLTSGTIPDAGGPDPIVTDGGAPLTGLPCDVRQVLQTHCSGCHTGVYYAPEITSRAEFLAESRVTGMSVGQRAMERMSPGAMAPMPPPGTPNPPSSEEVAIVSRWVEAGMPGGSCANLTAH